MRRWLLTRRSSWPVRARAWLEQRVRRVLAVGVRAAGAASATEVDVACARRARRARARLRRTTCAAGATGADVACTRRVPATVFVACNRFKSVGLPTLRDPDACSPLAVRVSLCRT